MSRNDPIRYLAVADTYRPRPERRPLVASPGDVARLCARLARRSREHLVVLLLDARGTLLAAETVAIGTLNAARAAPRDVFAPALKRDASGVILVHNHPSGCAEPSEDDVRFTRNLVRAGEGLGTPLYDHVILARDGHVSLRARGIVGP